MFLEEAVLTTAPRKWLHNPKLRAARAELERQEERDMILARAATWSAPRLTVNRAGFAGGSNS
jgi:hypothetical protein